MTTLTVQAEDAIYALNFLKSLRLEPPRSAGRTRSHIEAQRRLQTEMQIGRAVGVAENYLMMRAVAARKPEFLEPVPPPSPPYDADTKKLRAARSSFPKLLSFWKDDLGVDLEALTEWPRWDLIRELRHVLTHRLGLWQPALDPKPKLEDRIRQLALNVSVYRGPIPVTESDLDEAVVLALAMIGRLEVRRLKK